jgi:hypothetical protein
VEKCRSCGADVYFLKTASGKFAIVNAKPEKRYVMRDGVAIVEPTFLDHHATCPQSDQWRNRKDMA